VSHGELAERLGLERSSVTNLIRLNELEAPIFGMIETGDLSVGHGKALLGMPAGVARIELASRAGEEEWPVRRLENAVRAALNPPAAGAESAPRTSAAIGDAERQLAEYLSTKVRIRTDKTGKRGKLVVEFFDLDHFDALMSRIGVRLRS
jgi:ParB family chromosome partitioning protein